MGQKDLAVKMMVRTGGTPGTTAVNQSGGVVPLILRGPHASSAALAWQPIKFERESTPYQY
jgi:hypothetical protein